MNRWAPVLERAALALAVGGAALRWGVSGAFAGTGLNLFIQLLPILALAAWFAARGMSGGTAWRFTGVEVAVLALALVDAVSVLRASHRLAALELAIGHLASGLFLCFALQALGRGGLVALLLAALGAASVLAFIQYAVVYPDAAAQVAELPVEMRNRHAAREPQAAFLGPNQFAGFLVLALPLALGAAVDARRRGLAALAAPVATLGFGAACLALTGSLGAWVAAVAAAVAFIALALTRQRGRRAAVALAAGGAALLLALVLFTPLLEKAAQRSHSLHVRRIYWQAAARLVAERPLLGAGLGNFEEHYGRLKGDVQQETRQVHNDYLQVLAETGVVGFLAFAGFLLFGLRRATAAEAPPPDDAPPLPPWILPVAGAAAFLLLTVRFGGDLSLFGAGAAWTLTAWAAQKSGAPGPWTRIGVAAGFLGLLLHLAVDFDWVDPGVALALGSGVALLLAYGTGGVDVRLPAPACAAAASVLALIGAPLFILAGPALAADRELAEARAAEDPVAAAALAEAAQGHNPLQADAYVVYAAAQFRLSGMDPLRLESALQALDNAIALRPDHVSYRISAAQLNLAAYFSLRGAAGEVARARAAAHLARAREHQERGVALYPSHAQGRYDLGRLLDLLGERDRATPHYAEALRFSELAAREVENRADLQLAGIRRLRALARTGKTSEAVREAKRLLPLDGEGDVSRILEEVRRRPEILKGVSMDELDETTRPLIEAAVDAALNPR